MCLTGITRYVSAALAIGSAFTVGPDGLGAAPQASSDHRRVQEIVEAAGITGGLIVHLGCGDGTLTAALGAGDGYLVHGLDVDVATIENARQHIESLGLYGKVSADPWNGRDLPYIDNLVNLIVAEQPEEVPTDELLRVLAPGGVALISGARDEGRGAGDEKVEIGARTWSKIVKPWPQEIDQWTHYLHDATGNAVAHDARVGPPRHMQWMAEPIWCRNHHTLASISGLVSSGGRVFLIVDEAPAASLRLPPRWSLVARDAFNGVLLWKRPIGSWANHLRKFRSGPVQLPRRLVASGDRVFVTLGLDARVTALDAATGRTLKAYEQTQGTEEIVYHEGILLLVKGDWRIEEAMSSKKRRGETRTPSGKSILAVDCETGEMLWEKTEQETEGVMPLCLAAAGDRVFFQNPRSLVCLDLKQGTEIWRSPRRVRLPQSYFAPTLVVDRRVVLSADGKTLEAFSYQSGAALWSCPSQPTFRSPVDVLVAGGLVWIGPEFSEGRDPVTGRIVQSNQTAQDLWTAGHHHRCYRNKATDRFILTGKRGIEFFDLAWAEHSRNNWVRGVCQYGVMPSNGLIYAPSHTCGCFMEARLYGFWALAAEAKAESGKPKAEHSPRLEHGPAYDEIVNQESAFSNQHSAIVNHQSSIINPSDWPTYRHDPLRSGSTAMEIPPPLAGAWDTRVGGRLTAPVAAEGALVVASIDAHRVVRLDAREGKMQWAFTAGGRVDCPPTIYKGLVLFGCADGWVYCLRLADGKMAWRFRAAPAERRTVARDQLESVWPVHGSVLVQHDVAYVAAGRSSYLDGGIHLYGLDPKTGQIVCQARVRSSHPGVDDTTPGEEEDQMAPVTIAQNTVDRKTLTAPDKSDAFSMAGARSDVLVGDGDWIYLRQMRFDRHLKSRGQWGRHLFSTTGLLDDSEVHRSHLVLGTGDFRRIPVAYSWIANSKTGRYGSRLGVPYGMLLVFDDRTVWGVRRRDGYVLFAENNRPFSAHEETLPDFRPSDGNTPPAWKWSTELAIRPRAMLRAGAHLFLAGMPGLTDQETSFAAYEGRKGGVLRAVSSEDGKKVAEYELEFPPVWDGLAAANGRLFVSTTEGRVLCYSSR